MFPILTPDQHEMLGHAITLRLMAKNAKNNSRQKRRWSTRPFNMRRLQLSEFYTLVQPLHSDDPERFYIKFRMTPRRFDSLLHLIHDRIMPNATCPDPIPPEVRLSITLEYLVTGSTMRNIGMRYLVGDTTACQIIAVTCKVLWNCLKTEYVKEPDREDFIEIAHRFWINWNLPLCGGAFDGKLVRIRCPDNSGTMYYCYKGYFATNLMACVDADYCFTFVDIGAYGKQGDAGTFMASKFGAKVLNGTIGLPSPEKLPGSDTIMPHFFIADEAFPLKCNLMRPYSRASLTIDNLQKAIFNYRLSRARRVVENAFGILAARWRILLHTIEASADTAVHIISACVALHNYLKKTDATAPANLRYIPPNFPDYVDEDGSQRAGQWRRWESELDQIGSSQGRNHSQAAAATRDRLSDYFMTPAGSVPWQEEAARRS